jgi:uncharacterized protein involved in cysteine biosynthesis
MNSPAKFVRGLAVPFRGFKIVVTSLRLMVLSAIPVWICIGSIVALIWWFYSHPFEVLPYAIQWIPGLQSFVDNLNIGRFSIVDAILQGFFWVFLILFASYFSYILLSLIGAPFYSMMANIVLARKQVEPPRIGFLRWVVVTVKMLSISLFKLILFVGVGGALFFFSFLPAGMLFAPIIMCLMISFDCFDFSFEAMTFSIHQRWRFFYEHMPAFLGLAMIILIVGTIPGMFSLFLPLFIAGGADLFADLHKASQEKIPVAAIIVEPPPEPPQLKGNS